MTYSVWEYIFGEDNVSLPVESGISKDLLNKMRMEFRYFYPLDLRVSGKDLVPNHLTMSIYNHVAIFPERFWPRSFRANGHLLLNSEKMSKSTGNFMTIKDSVDEFGADATRLALADAGDSIEDANFLKDTANMAILRLFNLLEFAKDVYQPSNTYREGPYNYHDRVFDAEMSKAITLSEEAYKAMLYREVVKHAFFELQNSRDRYRDATYLHGSDGMHKNLLKRFVELQALLMSPIIPHFSDYVWSKILSHKTSILYEPFPRKVAYDEGLVASSQYLHDLTHQLRTTMQVDSIKKKPSKCENSKVLPDSVELYVVKTFPKWQEDVINLLRANYDTEKKAMLIGDDQIVTSVKPIMQKMTDKSILRKFIPFVMELKAELLSNGLKVFNRALPFDETAVLSQNIDYITRSLGLVNLSIQVDPSCLDSEGQKKFESALPGSPAIRFFKA